MPPSRLARFGGEKKIKERYKNKVQNLWKSLIGRATRVLSEDLKCFVHLYFRKLIIVLNLGLLLSGQDGQ